MLLRFFVPSLKNFWEKIERMKNQSILSLTLDVKRKEIWKWIRRKDEGENKERKSYFQNEENG